jgi:hypothetical protein
MVVDADRERVRVFDLASLSIEPRTCIAELRATFDDLPWDMYDVRRQQLALLDGDTSSELHRSFVAGDVALDELETSGSIRPERREHIRAVRPTRRRAVGRFAWSHTSEGWRWRRLVAQPFTQRTNDFRALPRRFSEIRDDVVATPAFAACLDGVRRLLVDAAPHVREFEMTVHQVMLVATSGVHADNAPEGIHQDGADYIVSALVVDRTNVVGGESRVFASDRTTCLLRRELAPGEGIFQADAGSDLWHDVTAIHVANDAAPGIRASLGFDLAF